MFKGARGDGDAGAATAQGQRRGMFSVLGADVAVTGNVVATADLHIDGRVEGDVSCGSLVQGAESVIVGRVTAESARLAGTIEGAVAVRELQVERSARIAGDVEYEAITIETGGKIDGNLRHKTRGTLTTVTNVTPIGAASAEQRELLG